MDFDKFPQREGQPRKVFFDSIERAEIDALRKLGYEAVLLMSLPRDTIQEHQTYLFGLMQGMTEGTITVDKDRISAAELELKARHMLNKDSVITPTSAIKQDDLLEFWKWNPSRHTLQGNTTIVDPRAIDIAAKRIQEKSKRAGIGKKIKVGKK